MAAALTMAAFAATPAAADMVDTSGMAPWERCALCHGLDGISRMSKFPRLAGQRPEYILRQVGDFRDRHRVNDGGQMQDTAIEVSEADMPAVARHFADSPAPRPILRDIGPEARARARTLYEEGDKAAGLAACSQCHAPVVFGPVTGPHLTSQHPEYLAKQMRDYRSGGRGNDRTGEMPRIAARLSDAEIDALAAYIAALPRESM
ncbi:MAG: cytochrome c [Hyphomicrobiales bacterium]